MNIAREAYPGLLKTIAPKLIAREAAAPAQAMRAIGGRFGGARVLPRAPQGGMIPARNDFSNFVPQIPLSGNMVQQSMKLNPNIMKQATTLYMAKAITDGNEKQAGAMWGTLSKYLGQAAEKAGPAIGAAKGLSGRVMPSVNKGFDAIGTQATKLAPDSLMSKLLIGKNRPVGPAAMISGQLQNSNGALGRQVAGRVGAGAGIGLGGTLAAEAPFKHENNEAYDQQQANPIKSWLAQHLAGAPKLQHKNYLNPLSV